MTSPSRLPSLRRPAGYSRPVSMIEGPLTEIPDFSAIESSMETFKKSKRRSLLPQFARKAADDAETKGPIVEGDGASPRPSEDTKGSTGSSGRKASEEERDIMLPPSKPSRPMSMVPPRQSSKLPGTRSHAHKASSERPTDAEAARADSLAALTGIMSSVTPQPPTHETGLKRAGSTRLPQAPRAGGPMIPSRTTSARPKAAKSQLSHQHSAIRESDSTTTITQGETTPSKLRLPMASVSPTRLPASERPPSITEHSLFSQPAAETAQATVSSRSSASLRPRPTSQIIPPSSKPNFNTYQQHYSPAKSALPKPPLPPVRQQHKPTAVTEDEPIDLDVQRQQIELLQLSLLHQASSKCLIDYTNSARRKLGKVHSRLRKEYENLRATELVHQRATNLAALDNWCPDSALLVENMQILSLVHSDLTSLMEDGSRHGDVVTIFELWMTEVETVQPGNFIQPLPDDWRASHGSLTLKLRSIQRNLRVLPPVQLNGEASGVEVVLKACKSLVDDMLKELDVMLKLEKEMMVRDQLRVEAEVDALITNDVKTKDAWIPAWQRVA